MEANLLEHNRRLKTQKTITVLIIISLILTSVCSLSLFTYYTAYGNNGEWEFHFSLFGHDKVRSIFPLLEYFISVTPIIFFAIYTFKYYKGRTTDSIPMVLVLIAFSPLPGFIRYSALGYGLALTWDLLVDILIVVSLALAAINSLKGFSKKLYIVTAVFCGLLGISKSLVLFISRAANLIHEGPYLYLFTKPLIIIGRSSLLIAILLFALKNNIPANIKKEKNTNKMSPEQSLRYLKEKNTNKMSPEQSLRYLKEKLDLGIITEEEYQAQRAEIINNL